MDFRINLENIAQNRVLFKNEHNYQKHLSTKFQNCKPRATPSSWPGPTSCCFVRVCFVRMSEVIAVEIRARIWGLWPGRPGPSAPSERPAGSRCRAGRRSGPGSVGSLCPRRRRRAAGSCRPRRPGRAGRSVRGRTWRREGAQATSLREPISPPTRPPVACSSRGSPRVSDIPLWRTWSADVSKRRTGTSPRSSRRAAGRAPVSGRGPSPTCTPAESSLQIHIHSILHCFLLIFTYRICIYGPLSHFTLYSLLIRNSYTSACIGLWFNISIPSRKSSKNGRTVSESKSSITILNLNLIHFINYINQLHVHDDVLE